MPNQHLDPNSINLTYGHPDGVPAPEPYSWKKALAVANAVWLARYKGTMRAEMQVRNIHNGTNIGMAYHVGSAKDDLNQLADQILTPSGSGPTDELLTQFPQLREAPFALPLQTAEAYQMLCSALDLEARNLWHQVFQDAKARGISWRQRNLPSMDYNDLGLRLSMSEVLEADRTSFAPKGHAAGATAALETEDFNYRDARYLARLIIKHHLTHEHKEGTLKNE